MATSGFESDEGSVVSRDMDCPVCFEKYSDPRALACLHTFCFGCLSSIVLKAKQLGNLEDGIECPLCRTVTKLAKKDIPPEDWVRELPPNYALLPLLESLGGDSKRYTGVMCEPCSKCDRNISSMAVVFCSTCNEYQCEGCSNSHGRFGFMEGHKIHKLAKDVNNRIQEETNEFSHLLRCHEHGKKIEFYCRRHKEMCCATCSIVTHGRCKNIEVREIVEEDNSNDVKEDIIRMIKKIELLSKIMDENEISLDRDTVTVEEKLGIMRANVLARFDAFQDDIRNKMYILKQRVKQDNVETRNEISGLLAALQGSSYIVDTVMTKGDRDAKWVVIEKMKQQCDAHQNSTERLISGVQEVSIDINISESLRDVCDISQSLGNVDYDSRDVDLSKAIRNLRLLCCMELERIPVDVGPRVTGLGFMRDGRIVMADNPKCEILITNALLERLRSHRLPYRPLGLTVLTTDEILLTSEGGLFIYKLNINNTIRLIDEIKTPLPCSSASEIDKDNFVVTCYATNTPVLYVSRQGDIKPVDGDFPDKVYELNSSRCCYSSFTHQIVFSFRDTDEIRLVDRKNGTTSVIKDTKLIKLPRGIVAVNGAVYVCSEGTSSIVQISFEGVITNRRKIANMKRPSSIAISSDNRKLLLSNDTVKDHKVNLFDLEAKSVSKKPQSGILIQDVFQSIVQILNM